MKTKVVKRGIENKNGNVKVKAGVAQGLHKLFLNELKDIYHAEKALTKAIPKFIEEATASELIEVLTAYLDNTKQHIIRLEDVFSIMNEKAEAEKCEAIEGLIKEAEHIVEKTTAGVVRDAGLISAVQKIEHHEIATYGTLFSFAKTLEEDEVATLLQTTLDEEKEADAKLSEIAETFINAEAAAIG